MKNNLIKKIEEYNDDIIKMRRKFHKYPELGMETYRTSNKIANYLNEWGYEVKSNVGKTGVVGLLRGKGKSNSTIAIRADIDALPISEKTGLVYSSKNDGIMHACGHDGHIAIALGTAKIISQYEFDGNIKFIFQPGEEIFAGAKAMIDDGVMKEPVPDFIIGFHIMPILKSGKIGIKKGPLLAAMDKFKIVIKGVGGHGALPEKTKDPIMVASEIITSSQRIISREVDSFENVVISFGKLNAGTAFNIIPDIVEIEGNIRTFNSSLRQHLIKRFKEMIKYICKAYKCEYKFNLIEGVPSTINDAKFTQIVESVITNKIEEDKLVEIRPIKVSEDFALFAEKVPGVYLILGTKNDKTGTVYSLHHPKYTIDEEILSLGVRVFCEVIIDYLNIK